MPEPPNSIERLPEDTRSKLRSTQILTSLPQIVSELLQNSLDADATHIDVGIDLKEWMCWVKDDGHGISKEGLEKLGQGEGGRYRSSFEIRSCRCGCTDDCYQSPSRYI
jgi:DNA mismatch repair protein MLH3